MNQEQLRKKIEHSLNEGFTEQEVRSVLRQQNVPHSQINKAFRQIKNQGQQGNPGNQQRGSGTQQANQFGDSSQDQGLQGNSRQQNNSFSQNNRQRSQNQNQGGGRVQSNQQNQQQGFQQDQDQVQNNNSGFGNGNDTGFSGGGQTSSSSGGAIPGLDLSDSYYRIRQQFFLTRYSVFDQNDNKVLKAKNKIFSIKTNIPFFGPDNDEEPIFRVLSARFPNISNNYKVRGEQNNDTLAVLDRKRTLLNQVWRIRDPDDNSIVATIQNDNTMLQFLRTYGGMVPLIPNFFALIPHTYNVTNVNDQKIGELEGELSIRDEYDLNLQDSGELDRESMIASIIAIDALEGN